MPPKDNRDIPITTKTIIAWTGVLAVWCGSLISALWWCANLQSQVNLNKQKFDDFIIKSEDDNRRRDKAIADDHTSIDSLQLAISDLRAQVDVAVVILHRIDEKVNKQ